MDRRHSQCTWFMVGRSCLSPRRRVSWASWRKGRWRSTLRTQTRCGSSPCRRIFPALSTYASLRKLGREAVEDFRIDFEDGFGTRADAEEDATVDAAVAQLAKGLEEPVRCRRLSGCGPSHFAPESRRGLCGRLKVFSRRRSNCRTSSWSRCRRSRRSMRLRNSWKRSRRTRVGVELMIETSFSLRNLTELVERTHGRCRGAHFGPYDYTSSLGITSPNQHLLHPACISRGRPCS